VFLDNIYKILFRGGTYGIGVGYGGDPSEIIKLKYEDVIKFYKKFYHPSNIKFFSYGDLNFINTIKCIEENYFSKIAPVSQAFAQNDFKLSFSTP